jgi:RNA ligase (TIGR02306 family)
MPTVRIQEDTVERKLVSVQVVETLAPIQGADQIEQARVMGWTVVVKKGEFAPGDPCVFFEIDSVLPEGPLWAELMRPRGFRVRTLKLRGVLSQGLALPVSILGGDAPAVGAHLRDLDEARRHLRDLLPQPRG